MIASLLLLADSAPLFRDDRRGKPWLAGFRDSFSRAVYLGASNGDRPEFYEIFEAVMDRLKVEDRRHIKANATVGDLEFMKGADLVVLAGGDVEAGLSAFAQSGIDHAIRDAYERKALLIGVSAGAVQLGVIPTEPGTEVGGAELVVHESPVSFEGLPTGAPSPSEDPARNSRGFRFAPFQIDVHVGPSFSELKGRVEGRGLGARGVGIPAGGAAILYSDGSLEPVGPALTEFVRSSAGIIENLLLPKPKPTPNPLAN